MAWECYECVEVFLEGVIVDMCWYFKALCFVLIINMFQVLADVYVLDVEMMDLQQWIFLEVGGLDCKGFVKFRFIYYLIFDQVGGKDWEIFVFYYWLEL